ncbi:UAA-domain-containing protein [Hysterangium stoloniferum]|nr:UAA-domain-containing protein [Hysterangium stoloniferum]
MASDAAENNGLKKGVEKHVLNDALPAKAGLAMIDYALITSLVFGGCCTNAWSLEVLLKQGSNIGSALTFSQMTFIAAQGLPSFIIFKTKDNHSSWIPRLKPRAIPLSTWLVQVILMVCTSLLNNWAFSYNVPLTVQIVVRSSGELYLQPYTPSFCLGLAVSMLFGYFTLSKSYTLSQIVTSLITSGVVLATLSGPSSSSKSVDVKDLWRYSMGVSMLVLGSLLTGYYGTLQERTYKQYGPHWKEGVFYTHLFSLPTFLFLRSDIQRGLSSLSHTSSGTLGPIPYPYIILSLNLVMQLVCTSSVNRLSSSVSSVSINLILTTRKALSLCISVWWFGNSWDKRLVLGASVVFIGTILYTLSSSTSTKNVPKEKTL